VDVSGTSSASLPGVQQIVLLPRAGKACVQCNWTVTFYSLPEMSPAFPSRQIKGCNFIGGIDLNELSADNDADYAPGDVSVLASTSKRIQAIRIGEELRPTQVCSHRIPKLGAL
jgi:vacuolar protein sorting-associated protein 3